MLLGTQGASLLANILVIRKINRAGEGIIRAGYGNKKCQNSEKRDKIMKTKWIFYSASLFN